MAQPPCPVTLHPRERAILERLARSRKLERRLAERVQIVLWSADRLASVKQARQLGVDAQRVNRWRRRFTAEAPRLAEALRSEISDEELEAVLLDVLSDEERSGSPGKFTAEQLTRIIELACKSPGGLGLPVTHWTPQELAIEAMRQAIVKSISPRHVARFFGGGRHQASPHAVLAESDNRRPRASRRTGGGVVRVVRGGPESA